MNTLPGNVFPMSVKRDKIAEYTKVTHVAFGCGCVRTFHVEHPAEAAIRCEKHGDHVVSTNQELVPKAA